VQTPSPPPSSRQNPLYDSTEFYVQCAVKSVHEHENFRWKPVKGMGGKERREARLDILSRGPRVPNYTTEPIWWIGF